MTIARLIEGRTTPIVSCTVGTLVRDAVKLLADKRIGAMPVFDGRDVAGIFSERDVIGHLASRGAAILDVTVGEVMTAPPITVDPRTDVLAALTLMTRRRVRHLPVHDGGRIVAFVSIGDLVKYRIDRIEAEADAMREYIQTS